MSGYAYVRRLVGDIARAEPRRAALGVVLMTLAALLEGLALAMLFPLLGLLGFIGHSGLSAATEAINGALGKIGISINLYTTAGLIVGLTLLQQVFYLAQAWVAAGLQVGFTARWRRQLTDAYLGAEWLYLARANGGKLSHVLNFETGRASHLINYGAQVIALCVALLTYVAIAFIASWTVTLALIAGGAAIIALSQYLVRHPGVLSARQTTLYTRFTSKASEVLGGMKLIRAVDGGAAVRDMLWPAVEELRQIERKVMMNPHVLRACFEFLAVAMLMVTLVLALTVLHSDGATFLLIAALFVRFYPRATQIQQYIQNFRISLPYYAAVIDALDEARAAAEPPRPAGRALAAPLLPPSLTLRAVDVSYGDRPVLKDVSLRIGARQAVAIVGASGAGKSTLVDMLLCLVPFQAGRIDVDGQPLAEIDLASWRRSIGYVSQDTFLFNASLRDNIAFAQPNAGIDDIRAAARKAHLLDFIESLPQGFDTMVGDRGVLLSGGQRQRVGIARALLCGRSLLILDEATAALDSETEAAIMHDIAELHGQITIVMIAHRLSTLRNADEIFVLEQGRIVESGSWETLIARRGVFQKLWGMQSEVPAPRVAAQ